jgi:hypothetical protein
VTPNQSKATAVGEVVPRQEDAPSSPARRDPQFWLASLLNDLTLRLCTVFTLAIIFMPAEGLGIDACISRLLTRAPCPGCGMTRSGANMLRGNLTRAMQYHPFGLVVIPAVVLLGVAGVMPRSWREGVRGRLLRVEPRLRPLWQLAFVAFVMYGVLRWAAVEFGLMSFPANWP